ncbi:MAG: OAM dimerization domain-containing protein [Bacteroidota bacterium]
MEIKIDLSNVRPYGDHLNDGMVQLSFTLPVPFNKQGKKAAQLIARQMGIEAPDVVHHEELLPGFTFFIIYGKCNYSVNYNGIKVDTEDVSVLSQSDIEAQIKKNFDRDLVVVGASTGTDTHTVGIDSILNMKGNDGHYGLERFKGFKVYNLGGQVPNEELLAKAMEVKADAILVSQTVTQQRLHIQNLTQFVDLVEAEGIRDKVLLIVGGARITNELAKELGYDAGFSKGSYSNHVATFMLNQLVK